MEDYEDIACFESAHAHSLKTLRRQPSTILPDPSILENSRSTLLQNIPEHGWGIAGTTSHLLQDIAPALNASSLSPNFYGFVIGGITPAARVADHLVSTYDQNPSVHLPDQTVASNVEDKALRLLLDLLRFDQKEWSGTFTTGATASNVLGLACGREYIINERIKSRLGPDSKESVGSLGLLTACRIAGVEDINVLTTMAHSSLFKVCTFPSNSFLFVTKQGSNTIFSRTIGGFLPCPVPNFWAARQSTLARPCSYSPICFANPRSSP